MLTSSLAFVTSLFTIVLVCVNSHQLVARQNCADNYNKCSPPGATATDTPTIGSGLSSLYVNILDSISGVKLDVRGLKEVREHVQPRAPSISVCCAEGTLCLLVRSLNVPFCYDKFTTNFFLPDRSYGSVTTGNYSSPDGSTANLLSGNYTLTDGTSGNIYGGNEAARPNTSTLSLPTQYTSAGVGSAIPANALGGEATYTTTIPGTTVEPTTIPPQIIFASVVEGSTVAPETTKPATTVAGTTIAPKVLTITTSGSVPATATATASAKQGIADLVSPRTTVLAVATGCMFIMFTFLGL